MRTVGLFFIPVAIFLASCSVEPQPIRFGEDRCEFCMMTVSDARYASQIVTRSGKSIHFDSIECMAAHEASGATEGKDISSRRVSDFESQILTSIDQMRFEKNGQYKSPMGGGLAAFSSESSSGQRGLEMSYDEVLHYAAELLLHERDSLDR